MADLRHQYRSLARAVPLDRHAAKQATKLAVLTVVGLYLLQMGVTAAVTSGSQPMVAVEDVPVQPQASAWEDAPSRTVNLQKQQMAIPYGGGSTDKLQVKALTNDSHVAFRLSWEDPTYDANIASPENYSDAAAIMFGAGEMPPIMMGGVGDPVNIWYWRASWEQTKSGYGTGGMYAYPKDRAGKPAMPGRLVDNPLSKEQYGRHAQHYLASGYGSLSYAPTQPVSAEATRTGDGWAVTFVRERGAGGEHDVTFAEGKDVYLAFAVWNGSADEVNGQKSITMQFTKLNPTSGALSAASGGSESSSGSGTPSGTAGGGDGGGGAAATGFTGWIAIVVGSVLLVWMVSYWRLSEP